VQSGAVEDGPAEVCTNEVGANKASGGEIGSDQTSPT
jgi:hypothetical protein